ncbi:PAC2 family protein [Devriesea agamarum]|uniref:PAC2 family protein n=1 Tax=Devriesea agamarum TaxID=472569 RepID=UPI00071CA780|nr:PAC2 family protein [Devriesea agamarum]
MLDPTTLFSYEQHIDSRTIRAQSLVVTLGAVADAGQVQHLINDHLLNSLENRVIGKLDSDQLYDYAGRRPEITLDQDHFADYAQPEILLHEVLDAHGTPFLLLTGPEPSFQWERAAASIRIVIEQLGINRIILAQGIPSAIPHTRPLELTRFAGTPSHQAVTSPFSTSIRFGAVFGSVLTLRLADNGHDVIGLAAHVPHYLSRTPYPKAVMAILSATEELTGLDLPSGPLAATADALAEQINAQVELSPQLAQMITQMEQQADQAQQTRNDFALPGGRIPGADEIGAEIEEFLREMGSHPESDDHHPPSPE